MHLILSSLIAGLIGMILGFILGKEIFMYMFGILGVLSPALYTLQNIYMKLEDLEKKLE